jgi:hypothetical protein
MVRDEQVIHRCKTLLDDNQQYEFFEYCVQILQITTNTRLDLPLIFHRVYLHACLRGRKEVADWMRNTLFPRMDPIQQIGLRQIFPYGNHLLSKAIRRGY